MSIGFGAAGEVNRAILTQQQRLQARDDARENTARDARNAFTFTTVGVGTLIAGQVNFDCQYIQEPHFTTGVVMAHGVDTDTFHMPMAHAGVYKWIKEPQLPYATIPDTTQAAYNPLLDTEPDDGQPMFYTGAYLYFEVQVKAREDADPAVVAASTPRPVLHHHLSFVGVAMKKLSATIASSKFSSSVPSRTTGLTLT